MRAKRILPDPAYRAAVRLRHGELTRRALGARQRTRARRLFRAGQPLTVDVGGNSGLGGVLHQAAVALHVGQVHLTDVALRFTSSTYRPSWEPDDWLDCYFTRLGGAPTDRPRCEVYDSQSLGLELPPMAERGKLVWNALRIRDDIRQTALNVLDEQEFAAVHFRGSDKFLEARRVDPDDVFARLDHEIGLVGLRRVFIASDESEIVREAELRYGDIAFSLPLEAMAAPDGTPPHFTDVSGEIKAREALMTMVILSRARLLVKTPSLLSDWATTLADDHQRVVCMS